MRVSENLGGPLVMIDSLSTLGGAKASAERGRPPWPLRVSAYLAFFWGSQLGAPGLCRVGGDFLPHLAENPPRADFVMASFFRKVAIRHVSHVPHPQ